MFTVDSSTSEVSHTEAFQSWLNTNKLGTVYFDESGAKTQEGNWDAHDESVAPSLRGVVYNSFFSSYGGMSSSIFDQTTRYASSSKSFNSSQARAYVIMSASSTGWYSLSKASAPLGVLTYKVIAKPEVNNVNILNDLMSPIESFLDFLAVIFNIVV